MTTPDDAKLYHLAPYLSPDYKQNKEKLEDRMKEEHAKNAIFMWYLLGIIFLILGKFEMDLLGLFIFWGLGMFIAGIASIVTYLLRYPILFIAAILNRIPGFVLLTHIFMWIIDIAWDVFIVLTVINLLNTYT